MVLCVWFPEWPLRDTPSDEPCFIVAGPQVVAANRLARGSGVEPGITRREAEGLCPGAVVRERDLSAELVAFEPVLRAIEALVPRVEIIEPGLALVALDGGLAFYGGKRRLVARLVDEIESMTGPGGRYGIADNPFAARWAARQAETVLFVEDDLEFLASLDVGVLEIRELADTFRWLGIRTLGDLSRLPRAVVASRFGRPGLEAHRLASGEDRPVHPRDVPTDLAVEERYPEPLTTLDQVGFAARRMAARLMSSLGGAAPHRVEIEAESGTGLVQTRTWRSADPLEERALTERVWWQLRAWSESGGVPGGLVRLRVTPADISGEGRQLGLIDHTTPRLEAERAVARAQSLLGIDGVWEARPQGGRGPSERVAWHRWGELPPAPIRSLQAPWPGGTPTPTPSLIPPEPRPMDVEWDEGLPVRVRLRSRWEPVLNWAGPWRHTGRWWAGEGHADHYQLVTSLGAFLCEVRDGKTYIVGIYD